VERRIIETNDGSKTIHLVNLNENYHSIHGAVQESEHVFIRNGLLKLSETKTELKILEIGFGTGLNAMLSMKTAALEKMSIYYEGLEAYPPKKEELSELNYQQLGQLIGFETETEGIINCEWNVKIKISNFFTLCKKEIQIENYSKNDFFDLVYFDAFGPRTQPEIWSLLNFKKIYNALRHRGIFVTYCAKGQVRRDLISVGFQVEKLPGPPGKREMIRAFKN
jgi:tRNA U34 5-methylaminomethyl-2-thiouridine-forming methyltransferase MnmC